MSRLKQPTPTIRIKTPVLGSRAFAAISAVEGLKLDKASKERLKALQSNEKLTPAQRRAEVIRAYSKLAHKK
jgi:hypothetical protein